MNFARWCKTMLVAFMMELESGAANKISSTYCKRVTPGGSVRDCSCCFKMWLKIEGESTWPCVRRLYLYWTP